MYYEDVGTAIDRTKTEKDDKQTYFQKTNYGFLKRH